MAMSESRSESGLWISFRLSDTSSVHLYFGIDLRMEFANDFPVTLNTRMLLEHAFKIIVQSFGLICPFCTTNFLVSLPSFGSICSRRLRLEEEK